MCDCPIWRLPESSLEGRAAQERLVAPLPAVPEQMGEEPPL
jgi:hypothetical protein